MKLVTFSNLGNTCYINSVLHAFIYDSKFDFFTKINELITIDDLELETVVYNLTDFINFFISKFPHFQRFQQHDAHEFLTCLIDVIDDKECIGNTLTKIQCDSCDKIVNVHEDFTSINLSVPKSDEPISIFKLFENYLDTEVQSDQDNLYFCDPCNKNVLSSKKTFLWKLPKKLILVLKRYSSCGEKIKTTIDYPQTLKVKEISSDQIITYKLSCVINHLGGLYDGHYNSFVKLNDMLLPTTALNVFDFEKYLLPIS